MQPPNSALQSETFKISGFKYYGRVKTFKSEIAATRYKILGSECPLYGYLNEAKVSLAWVR